MKSNIELKDVIDLVKQCENEGFLLEKTKRDFEKFVEDYNNDKIDLDKDKDNMVIENVQISPNEQELPFNHEEKIITFPL